MKKFTSIMAVAAALSFSAYAVEPTPITIPNGDFESVGTKIDDNGDEVAKAKGDKVEESWMPSNSANWFTYCNWSKADSTNPDRGEGHGTFYARCVATSGEIAPGTYISQEIERPGKGVYALTARVLVSRNSAKGGLTDANFAFLFLGDQNSDIDDVDDPGYLKIFQTNEMVQESDADGNLVFNEDGTPKMVPIQDYRMHTVRVIIESTAKRGGLNIAYGVPEASAGFSKGWVEVDSMTLDYFGEDATVEDAEAYYEATSGVEGVEVIAPVQDNRIFNLQGIEVKEAVAPGIYIQNGKKFIVK